MAGVDHGLRVLSVLTSGAAAVAVQAAGALLAFLTQLVCARLLGSEEFGVFAFYFSLATIVGAWSRLGSDMAVLRIGGEATTKGTPGLVRQVLTHAQLVASFGGLAGGLILVAVMIVTGIAGGQLTTLLLSALLALPIGINGVRQAGLLVVGRALVALTPEMIIKPTVALMLLGSSYLAYVEATSESIIAIMVVSAAVSSVVLARLLRRHLPINGVGRVQHVESARWTKLGISLMFVNASYLLFYYSDTLLLGYVLKPEAIGPYQVAKQISQIGLFAMISVQFAFSARIAALVAGQEWVRLRDLFRSTVKLGAGFAALVLLAFAFLGNQLVALFGGSFSIAFELTIIFLLAQLAIASLGPVGVLASMSGHQAIAVASYLIGAGLVFVLGPMLVEKWGLIGGAMVHASVSVGCAVGIYAAVARKVPIGMIGTAREKQLHSDV